MNRTAKKPEKIALLTDSCADMTVKKASENGIYVIPLRIIDDDAEYLDGVNIFSRDIYDFQEQGKMLKTSLPSGNDVLKIFDRIAADGYDGVIAVMFSSGLSGTYNFVKTLAGDRSDMLFKVYDSRTASLGLAMILLQLAEDIRNGADWTKLTEKRVPYLIENTFAYFSVDTLDHLHRGGRIGYITSVAGTLLNIKPIIGFSDDGQLKTAAKARGTAQVIEKLADLVYQKRGSHTKYNLAVANGGMPEEMEKVKQQVMDLLPDYAKIQQGEIGGTLSVHIGKGILGSAIQILE